MTELEKPSGRPGGSSRSIHLSPVLAGRAGPGLSRRPHRSPADDPEARDRPGARGGSLSEVWRRQGGPRVAQMPISANVHTYRRSVLIKKKTKLYILFQNLEKYNYYILYIYCQNFPAAFGGRDLEYIYYFFRPASPAHIKYIFSIYIFSGNSGKYICAYI